MTIMTATVRHASDEYEPEDGWWFQCCPCPARQAGGVDRGPFEDAASANDAAREHLREHEGAES